MAATEAEMDWEKEAETMVGDEEAISEARARTVEEGKVKAGTEVVVKAVEAKEAVEMAVEEWVREIREEARAVVGKEVVERAVVAGLKAQKAQRATVAVVTEVALVAVTAVAMVAAMGVEAMVVEREVTMVVDLLHINNL